MVGHKLGEFSFTRTFKGHRTRAETTVGEGGGTKPAAGPGGGAPAPASGGGS